jgi:hypothetical protein
MSQARRFDHVGITVADLDTVTGFFVGLGLEVEGRMFVCRSRFPRRTAAACLSRVLLKLWRTSSSVSSTIVV